MIQYMASGYNTENERVVLWRKGDYKYELEIGTGLYKKSQDFEAECNDAMDIFYNSISAFKKSDFVFDFA